MSRRPKHSGPTIWFNAHIGNAFVLAPELLAEQFTALAVSENALALHWLNQLGGGQSRHALMRKAADAVGTVNARVSADLESRSNGFVITYDDPAARIEEKAIAAGRSPDEAEALGKAPRYALAFYRIGVADLYGDIRRCDLRTADERNCGKWFFAVDKRTRWCPTRHCGAKAFTWARRAKLSIEAWLQQQAREIRKQQRSKH